jgi:hypothetical protein
MRHTALGSTLALLVACSAASAQWADDFDSYPDGTLLYEVNGWTGWDGASGAAGTVTNAQAFSAPHSIAVSGTGDAVHPFSGYDSGVWTFTAYQYIPDTLDALTYFILNDVYNHGGPYDWAVEMHMDPATGLVTEIAHNDGSSTPILYNQWVEIRTLIDLDNNYMENYYNGVMLASGVWDVGGDGLVELQNVDLYAPHTETVYYDNFSLVPAPGTLAALGLGLCAIRRRR